MVQHRARQFRRELELTPYYRNGWH